MFQPLFILIALLAAQARTGQAPAPTTPGPQTPAQTSTPAQAAPTPQTPLNIQSQPVQANTAAAPSAAAMFVTPMTVAQMGRLALTPNIDGKIDPEEWDPFSNVNGVDTYFQWEPRKLHFAAAHVPAGQDMIISIDAHGDSWLVGRDNLEIRVHWQGDDPQLTERLLDNTPVSGPVWVDASNYRATTAFAGSTDSTGHTIEITATDPGTGIFPERAGEVAGIRFDIVPESTPPAEPLLPRVMVPCRTQLARGEDVPAGLTWKPEVPERTVVPGESDKIRLTFKGTDELGLKRIDMRTEGLAANDTGSSGVPFPKFDSRGRAFVDYRTSIARTAALGYRIMKATMVDIQGKSCVMETSFEIAPIISFDFHNLPQMASSEPQNAKFTVILESHTEDKVNGIFRVQVPDGWKVKDGDDKTFIIYYSRGNYRQDFSITIPGGFKGTAPIKLITDFNGSHSEQTEYIVVQ